MAGNSPEEAQYQDQFPKLTLEQDGQAFHAYLKLFGKYLANDPVLIRQFSFQMATLANLFISVPKLDPIGRLYLWIAEQAFEFGELPAQKERLQQLTDQYSADDSSAVTVTELADTLANRALTISETAALSKTFRQKNLTIAYVHGHFRTFTPSSVIFLLNAQLQADVLFVGIETAERTEQFKGKKVFFTDAQRGDAFRKLYPFTFFIDNSIPYTSEGYASLLAQIYPHRYIGQASNPEWQKNAMRARADALGIEYVELASIPGFSTSRLSEAFQEHFGDWW